MNGVLILILAVAFLVFFYLIFRTPAPKVDRFLWFLLWLGTLGALGYMFAVEVMEIDPDPYKLSLARRATNNKIIDLSQVVPGLPEDLEYIQRLDTDADDADAEGQKEEWFVFYRYDSATQDPKQGIASGPFGAAIYDPDWCRPPAIMSYELVPANYDYLGQTEAQVVVENIIDYKDPLSRGENRPEVIVGGKTGSVFTDLNVFRKVGVPLTCLQRQEWQATHAGEAFPNPLRYENIGSFRGNFRVRRSGNRVTVADRSPFERSQIIVERHYDPRNGSYFLPGTETLVEPVWFNLAFGTGIPGDVPEVYYPEKAVLAFYLNLGKDGDKLDEAESYLIKDTLYDIETDPFGLSTDPASVARARTDLDHVLVWEIRYRPDVEAEHLHRNREVTVTVVGVNEEGEIDTAHPCVVTWTVVGVEDPGALPYGCQWALESYWSTCAGGK